MPSLQSLVSRSFDSSEVANQADLDRQGTASFRRFMKQVNKSVLIWYSPEEMFALVTDVERYPEFLPWCDRAKLLERTSSGVVAEISISMAGVRQTFVTRNTHEEGRRVVLDLVKGPFSQLSGDWKFDPVGEGQERAARVSLQLDYGFDSLALAALVGPIFDRIAGTLMDAFVKRAEQVYG